MRQVLSEAIDIIKEQFEVDLPSLKDAVLHTTRPTGGTRAGLRHEEPQRQLLYIDSIKMDSGRKVVLRVKRLCTEVDSDAVWADGDDEHGGGHITTEMEFEAKSDLTIMAKATDLQTPLQGRREGTMMSMGEWRRKAHSTMLRRLLDV